MKISLHLVSILIIAMFVSCSSSNNEIIETDLNKLLLDTSKPITVKESQIQSRSFYQEVITNTVGRKIPKVKIHNVSGGELNLKDLIKSESIIISSDVYCSWGIEGLTNDFPKVIELLRQNYGVEKFCVICLLKREKSDIENPERFNKTFDEVKLHYQNLFIIDEKEARKLNLYANPTRLYVNKNLIVTNIGLGVSTIEGRLYEEICENMVTNSKNR